MLSACSFLFTLVLFSELNSRLVTVASPAPKAEDGDIEQDDLNSLLGDEPLAEHAMVPSVYRGGLVLDNSLRDEDGNRKIVIFSDVRLKGHGVRGLSSALARSRTPADYSFKLDRRDTDFNMLRCMIGRVYRPCWESSNVPLGSA